MKKTLTIELEKASEELIKNICNRLARDIYYILLFMKYIKEIEESKGELIEIDEFCKYIEKSLLRK